MKDLVVNMDMLAMIIALVGVAAFAVAVVVEVFKNVSILKKVPTDLVVVILSIIVAYAGYFAMIDMNKTYFAWYLVLAVLFVGFVIALVAMNGWQKVSELAKRFIKKKEDIEKEE